LSSGALLSYRLNNSLQSDLIALTADKANEVVFTGNTIDFTDLTGGGLSAGQYVLFSASAFTDYSGLTFTGNTIATGLAIGTGLSAYPGSTLQKTGTGNIVLNLVATPEPTSLSLVGLSAIGLLVRRRRTVR
jgi:hypothetical protein